MCGRRMYVAALILASKFLLDRTYSNRAWNKITRLDIKEINEMERAFMALLDSQLYIPPAAFERWDKMLPHITVKGCRLVVGDSNSCDEVLLRPFLSPPTPAPSPISVCGGISAPASPAPTANSG
ncbi:PHO85 cyclin-5, partial [Spiromyces aspiralis]